MSKKNKRRVSMLLNSQTIYHIQKEAEREGISVGEVVDRLVREERRREHWSDIRTERVLYPFSQKEDHGTDEV